MAKSKYISVQVTYDLSDLSDEKLESWRKQVVAVKQASAFLWTPMTPKEMVSYQEVMKEVQKRQS